MGAMLAHRCAAQRWNDIRTDALAKRAGTAAHDPGIRKDSLAPRINRSRSTTAKSCTTSKQQMK